MDLYDSLSVRCQRRCRAVHGIFLVLDDELLPCMPHILQRGEGVSAEAAQQSCTRVNDPTVPWHDHRQSRARREHNAIATSNAARERSLRVNAPGGGDRNRSCDRDGRNFSRCGRLMTSSPTYGEQLFAFWGKAVTEDVSEDDAPHATGAHTTFLVRDLGYLCMRARVYNMARTRLCCRARARLGTDAVVSGS